MLITNFSPVTSCLQNPTTVLSTQCVVHVVCGPRSVWSMQCVVHAVCGPRSVWSTQCVVHAVCGPRSVWSTQCEVHVVCATCGQSAIELCVLQTRSSLSRWRPRVGAVRRSAWCVSVRRSYRRWRSGVRRGPSSPPSRRETWVTPWHRQCLHASVAWYW